MRNVEIFSDLGIAGEGSGNNLSMLVTTCVCVAYTRELGLIVSRLNASDRYNRDA